MASSYVRLAADRRLSMSSTIACPVCPDCASPSTKYLAATSADAFVHYCRCDACGHVWTVPKDGHAGEPRDVTERRNK
jgi:hypothetical protein